ncbi:MAG TPA: hypothetical protein VFP50_07905 [Anaeromyxobacteraceae bacterium]|nr:hypothetical protein [Anaeromyxobacteraceae bacterium]
MNGRVDITVYLAMAAYPPLAIAAFKLFGPRRGLLAALVGGWLFLPWFDGRPELIPMYDVLHVRTKASLVSVVLLLVSLALDWGRWRSFRPRLLDLPVVVLCLLPAASALANGLGANEGGSAVLEGLLAWGVPWLLGRVYLGDPGGLLDLALALVSGALAYVPFCLWEIRMSPQLHRIVYGFYQHHLSQTYRPSLYGLFRPMVFLQHPLMVALFMASAAVAALWLWRTGARRTVGPIPIAWAGAVLVAMTLLCKSVGSIALLGAGLAALEATRRLRTTALVVALALVPPAYCAARLTGWAGDRLVAAATDAAGADRAESLEFRLLNEDMLIAKALQHPWLGWGRAGGGFRVYDERGRDISITDGLWIITLGVLGVGGLAALGLVLLLPPWLLVRAFPGRHWGDRRLAPATALAVAMLMGAVDSLLNAEVVLVFPVLGGALASFSLLVKEARAHRRRRRPRPRIAPAPARPGTSLVPTT